MTRLDGMKKIFGEEVRVYFGQLPKRKKFGNQIEVKEAVEPSFQVRDGDR